MSSDICQYNRAYGNESLSSAQERCQNRATHPSKLCTDHRHLRTNLAFDFLDASVRPAMRITKYAALNSCFNRFVPEHKLESRKPCSRCGSLMWDEEKTRSNGSDAPFQGCCEKGRLSFLNQVPEPPELIQRLLTGEHPLSNHFLKNIRLYNSVLSFASFRSKEIVDRTTMAGGPDIFTEATFSEIFFFELSDQLQRRTNLFPHLNAALVSELQEVLMVNPYCRIYRTFAQSSEFMSMVLHSTSAASTENWEPSETEVAALLDETDLGTSGHCQIVVTKNATRRYECIPSWAKGYYPLVYALIFTKGGAGWHRDLRDQEGTPISMLTYFRYLLFSS